MKRNLLLSLLALGLLFVGSCDAEVEGDDDDTSVPVAVELSGAVEKGPFILGTTVNVSPVDAQGGLTGEVFNTATVNNLGEFNVNFSASGYVALEGIGYYYNEVTGALSTSLLTLRAFHDVAGGGPQAAYLNLMTHLSYSRVQTLVAGGMAFTDAIAQAEQEVRDSLGVGPIGYDPGAPGTGMNILGGDTDPNAYLFAVSTVIAQAASTAAGPDGPVDATLQELVNNISVDLEADGLLDSATSQQLLDAQQAVNPEEVMTDLAARLATLGSSGAVPNLNRFIDTDLDGVANEGDNCRYESNVAQDDMDEDGAGVACDCDDNDPTVGDTGTFVADDADCDGLLNDVTAQGMTLLTLASGAFQMGCTVGGSDCASDEFPVHSVTLTNGFWMSETEVTQGQWQTLMGNNPSIWNSCGIDCPVEGVTWYAGLAFANTMSTAEGLSECYTLTDCTSTGEGLDCSSVTINNPTGSVYDCEGYRLPTEAEWEYAARAGTDLLYAGSNTASDVAWCYSDALVQLSTTAVATKAPNAWGLYDMSGNVWEWVWDRYVESYYGTSPGIDPEGPGGSSSPVIRGGGVDMCEFADVNVRVANRFDFSPGYARYDLGLRLARTVP